MKISYLQNGFVFLEMYAIIENNQLKIKESKINSIAKFLSPSEFNKVKDNVEQLVAEFEKVQTKTEKLDEIFKLATSRQTGAYPIESFSIDIDESLDLPLSTTELLKAAIFLCCSNISQIIRNNAKAIENEIEAILTEVRMFANENTDNKLLDILVKDDEDAKDDLIISLSINGDRLTELDDISDSFIISETVIEIMENLAPNIKQEIVPVLVEDEIILRIIETNDGIEFAYNNAIVNHLCALSEDEIKVKCNKLISYLKDN
jgi:hypothetical protein